MAQSDNLRHIQRLSGGGKTTYKEGAKTENMVATAVQCVFKTLKNNHRNLEFMHMKKHSKQMFAESIGVVDYVPSNGKSFVNPDGGTIWVKKTYSDGSTCILFSPPRQRNRVPTINSLQKVRRNRHRATQ